MDNAHAKGVGPASLREQHRSPEVTVPPVVRPALKPLHRLWRDPTTVQLGLDPGLGVILTGLAGSLPRLLDLLDGTRDVGALRSAAAGLGVDEAVVDRLLDLLTGAGVLEDAASPTGSLRALTPLERGRLAPDLGALALADPAPDARARLLARRSAAVVEVVGAGRVGASVAALLAASSVGTVVVSDPGATRPDDLAPGALDSSALGAPRGEATRALLHRLAPGVRTQAEDDRRDLVVLAPVVPPSAEEARGLLRAGVAHLVAAIVERTGVVGPLVLPGRTPCLHCLDLHRSDRDPAWPRLATQLGRRAAPADLTAAALAAAVAGQTAVQALAVVDDRRGASPGSAAPAAAGATLELIPDGAQWVRRRWAPHPACGCRWRQG